MGRRGLAGAIVLVLAMTAVRRARADGGYFSGTTGARAAGRAGAFTARADDVSAVLHNPAGLARIGTTLLQGGNRFSYNASAFRRAPTLDWGDLEQGVPPYVTFAEVENDAPAQWLEPLLGVATDFGLSDWGFALVAYAPAGVGKLEFPVDGGQRYMMVRRDALLLTYSASAAWQVREEFGVGASLQWVHVPKLEYSLVIDANPFAGRAHPVSSELDMLATVSGSDAFTFNAVVGAWYRPLAWLELALSGQLVPATIGTDSTLAVEPLSPAIDDDVVLRREGEPANDVRLELPLPITLTGAIRYRHVQGGSELFDIELDLTYESWSRVERFAVDSDGIIANLLGQRVEIGRIDIEKQWRDTLGVRLGGDYALLPQLATVRAGVFYTSAVAERRYAHVDFASGQQFGAALGASLFVLGAELVLAYQYRHQPAVSIGEGAARVFQQVPGSQCEAPFTDPDDCHPQYLGRPAPAVNAGTYHAHAHAASLDVIYRF